MLKNVASYSNISCLNTAIWHTNKNLAVYDCGHGEYGFRVTEEDQEAIGNVASITIDDIIAKYDLQTIDILKVDIEGAEKELFSCNYENWLPRVRCIIIELHDSFKPGCASSFFKAIASRDYTMYSKGDNITVIFN
jgi:FkbM family methyltransferase